MKKSKNSNIDSIIHDLKQDYIAHFPKRLQLIAQLIEEKNLEQLQSEFHKLKGNGKTLGFQWISVLSGNIEDLIKTKSSSTCFDEIEPLLRKALTLMEIGIRESENFNLECQPLWRDIKKYE